MSAEPVPTMPDEPYSPAVGIVYAAVNNIWGPFGAAVAGHVVPFREIARGYKQEHWRPYSWSGYMLSDLSITGALVMGACETVSVPFYWAGRGARRLVKG